MSRRRSPPSSSTQSTLDPEKVHASLQLLARSLGVSPRLLCGRLYALGGGGGRKAMVSVRMLRAAASQAAQIPASLRGGGSANGVRFVPKPFFPSQFFFWLSLFQHVNRQIPTLFFRLFI